MTTRIQSNHWVQPSIYYKKVQRNKTQTYSRDQAFIEVRRSRKGTHLNIPNEFYSIPLEQNFIGRLPILPTGGCSDMEYVMLREDALKRQLMSMQNQTYRNELQYSPSVTINIGTPVPTPTYKHNQFYTTYQRNLSYSTISINPSTVASEEPWQQRKNVVPLGLYCCENTHCNHTPSVEQRVINLESYPGAGDAPENTNKDLDDKGFVYVTTPPTISPLTACWKFLTCKKKQKNREIYMPSVMTKTDPKECQICPKCSKTESVVQRLNGPARTYGVAPKLSTITESDMTISEYSSEEFISQEEKERRDKNKFEHPKKPCKSRGKALENPSFYSGILSTSQYPPGQVHRWVCQPAGGKKKRFFGKSSNKKYICYKESLKD